MISRRHLITATSSVLISLSLPQVALTSDKIQTNNLQSRLKDTDVLYLTPILSDGTESKCQAEVWFVSEGSDVFVVTAVDAWRAQAVRKGLVKSRIWVGDVGVWKKSKGKYKSLPSYEARAALVADLSEHERVLNLFGSKYSLEWMIWGSRFKDGLTDGSRVMLRYQQLS